MKGILGAMVGAVMVATVIFASGYLMGLKTRPYIVKQFRTVIVPDSKAGHEAILQWQRDLADRAAVETGMTCWVERDTP